ncbi:glycosyltransferase [Desertimonas flava]|uniref:glycosyltransferase n=1 Tax=Desertimonas flava TaxID=2064846 RepID=UPI000E342947|nr:glycosyltransferase [Desertimonas flava]
MTGPPLDHLLAMSDGIGLFEHAEFTEPRATHGYCTDDVARLLVVMLRQSPDDATARVLARLAFRFLADSQGTTGRTRNRRAAGGRWRGRHGVEDCWGRSLWAFGSAARRAPEQWMRQGGMSYFGHGAARRSPHRRAMAFAALGAAEVVAVFPRHVPSRRLLADAVVAIGRPSADVVWPWPEERLRYANAALPEALIAAGDALGRTDVIDDGLSLLAWLLDHETLDGHLSPTPVGGRGPGDAAPAFDQQPIEVAAMADACARAATVTGDPMWIRGVDMAVLWFEGDNDASAVMWDPITGGGFDGLEATGVNRNQGAESTLALVSTMQYAVSPRDGTDAVEEEVSC